MSKLSGGRLASTMLDRFFRASSAFARAINEIGAERFAVEPPRLLFRLLLPFDERSLSAQRRSFLCHPTWETANGLRRPDRRGRWTSVESRILRDPAFANATVTLARGPTNIGSARSNARE
jgi:hypothetical protein